jgi:hypothetical protein
VTGQIPIPVDRAVNPHCLVTVIPRCIGLPPVECPIERNRLPHDGSEARIRGRHIPGKAGDARPLIRLRAVASRNKSRFHAHNACRRNQPLQHSRTWPNVRDRAAGLRRRFQPYLKIGWCDPTLSNRPSVPLCGARLSRWIFFWCHGDSLRTFRNLVGRRGLLRAHRERPISRRRGAPNLDNNCR